MMRSRRLLRRIKAFIIWSVVVVTWAIPAGAVTNAYSFKLTYGDGDYYTGTVYAAPDYGYSASYTKTTTDEKGQTDTYTITGVTTGYDASKAGQVYVASYYDQESGNTYTPVSSGTAVGTNYLGSEHDYIIKSGVPQYLFGSSGGTFYEADLVTYAYTYKLTYGDGDYYTGTVYAAPEYGYSTTYTKTVTDEKGQTDTYTITGVDDTGYDVSKAGQVSVDIYYDAQSDRSYTPSYISPYSTSYLGSEFGEIVSTAKEYWFGWNNDILYEADAVCSAYNFTFTYGSGDYYVGTVYAYQDDGYSTSYSKTTTDENGQTGIYTITGVTLAYDVDKKGQVYVTSYYDQESGKTYTPVSNGTAVGTNYLGSEYDYIIKSGVPEYYFGGGYYEADLVSSSNLYTFKFTYADGDYYTGTVYATPGYGYSTGYTKSITDEYGHTDTYTITGVTTGYDVSKVGQVFVDSYYDEDSATTYTPVSSGTAVGTNYLGSESDYIIQSGVFEYLFGSSGGVFYEANKITPIFYESFDSYSSITANGGTYSGITLTTGKSGEGALIENGSSLSYSAAGNLNLQEGTIDFWFEPNWNGNVDEFKTFFWFTQDGTTTDMNALYFTKYASYNYADVGFYDNTGELARTWNDTGLAYVQAGEWHRVRLFWDFSSDVSQKYIIIAIDDHFTVYYPDSSFKGTFDDLGSSRFYIGTREDGSRPLDGVIDEFKIYDKPLITADDLYKFNPQDSSTVTNLQNMFKNDGISSNFETYNSDPNDCSKLSDSVKSGENVLFYQTASFEKVYENTVPTESEITNQMSYEAAQNSTEDLFFNVYSRIDLNNVEVTYTDFYGSDGNVISKSDLDLRVVKNWFQAGASDNIDALPVYTPELLLYNDQVNYDQGNWTWADLPSVSTSDHVETKISQYTSKQFVLIAKVPAGTPAGTYTCTVTLKADGIADQQITLKLEVLPFELQDSNKDYVIFDMDSLAPGDSHYVSTDVFKKDLQDIRDHGFNGVVLYFDASLFEAGDREESLDLLKKKLLYAKEAGFTKIVYLLGGPYNLDLDYVKELRDFMVQNGYEPYFYGQDEADTDDKLKTQISMAIIQTEAGVKSMTSITKGAADRLADPNDPIYSNFPSGTYEPLDWANYEMDKNSFKYVSDLESGVVQKTSTREETIDLSCWHEDLASRFYAGYYLWNSKLDGYVPWVYQCTNSYGANPYNDFVSDSYGARKELVTYPSQEGPIPTFQWEALRAGINDERYLQTWQYYEDQVASINPDAAQASKTVVDGVLARYESFTQGPNYYYSNQITEDPMTQYDTDRKTIIQEILKLEQDLSYAYTFKFTYGDGDYYTGTVYASPDYGYATGYTKTITDENGQTDTYTITGVSTTVYDASKAGQVYVTSYYDKGSGNTYTPVSNGTAVGTSYLGSEHDYIIQIGVPEYLFGSSGGTFYEADLVSYAYAFKLTYADGDYYTGTVYATPEYGYSTNYTKTTTDEKGQTDTYTITGVSTTVYDASKAGQVYVTSYYDAGSGNTYTPVSNGTAVGTSYLGSEHDYIIQSGVSDYLFGSSGGTFYEADLGTPMGGGSYSRYDFKYFYNNGSGDYYTGYVYAPTSFQTFLTVGTYIYDQPMSLWASGYQSLNGAYYYITGVTDGYASSYDKQSYITSYYCAAVSANLWVNSDDSATASMVYVSDRSTSFESGYVIDGSQSAPFSPYTAPVAPSTASASLTSASSSTVSAAESQAIWSSYWSQIPSLLDEEP